MAYWLLKSDPETYGFDNLVKDGRAVWDGVRNPQARQYLSAMRSGDTVFIYHSQKDKEIVGLARIVSSPYPDPQDSAWVVVDIVPLERCPRAVSLEQIKHDDGMKEMLLVKQSRLSVMPVTSAQARRIEKLAGV